MQTRLFATSKISLIRQYYCLPLPLCLCVPRTTATYRRKKGDVQAPKEKHTDSHPLEYAKAFSEKSDKLSAR